MSEINIKIKSTFHYCLLFFFTFHIIATTTTTGTKVVINLCIKYNIPRLVYTSTSAVTLMPYMGRATFSVIINQTESKAKTPSTDNGFLIPGYPSSKLRAEKIVLNSYGATLANGVGMFSIICTYSMNVCSYFPISHPPFTHSILLLHLLHLIL